MNDLMNNEMNDELKDLAKQLASAYYHEHETSLYMRKETYKEVATLNAYYEGLARGLSSATKALTGHQPLEIICNDRIKIAIVDTWYTFYFNEL